jgi:hypothetical protein
MGDKNRALALQTVLGSETGIRRVSANELTGRILVEYSPQALEEPLENLIQRAAAFGPLLPSEYAALSQPEQPQSNGNGLSALGCLSQPS